MDEKILNTLIEIVGTANVLTEDADKARFSHDMSYHAPCIPDVVVIPRDAIEISKILRIANRHAIPVTPFGAGTGLEGNAIPKNGGIVISLGRMNRLIRIESNDLLIEAEAGITCSEISKALMPYQAWIPTFPGAESASLGGIIATNASGRFSTLYGSTGDHTLSFEVVLAGGQILALGRSVQKTVSGFDLKRLFIGSEGTLGVITKAQMRFRRRYICLTAVAAFPDSRSALAAVELFRQQDLEFAALEFSDQATTQLMIDLGAPLELSAASLLIEIHTHNRDDTRLSIVQDLCSACHCIGLKVQFSDEEANSLWRARNNLGYAIADYYPDRLDDNGEVVVPASYFTRLVSMATTLGKESGIPVLIWGHAGQGNIHTSILGRRDNPSELQTAHSINERLINWAISVGGTATGEHGIGMSKTHYLLEEHRSAINFMKSIKDLFDPKGIMNPGKVFPKGWI